MAQFSENPITNGWLLPTGDEAKTACSSHEARAGEEDLGVVHGIAQLFLGGSLKNQVFAEARVVWVIFPGNKQDTEASLFLCVGGGPPCLDKSFVFCVCFFLNHRLHWDLF